MTVDSELCRKVADWAEANPFRHNQDEWIDIPDEMPPPESKPSPSSYPDDEPYYPIAAMREGSCGTAGCIAGITAILAAPDDAETNGSEIRFGGQAQLISVFAADKLGLAGDQWPAVFFAGRETAIARLRYLADHPEVRTAGLLRAVPDPLTIPHHRR